MDSARRSAFARHSLSCASLSASSQFPSLAMHPVSRGPAAAPSLSLQAAFQRHLGIADAPQVEPPPLPPASSRAGQAAAAVPSGAHVDPTAIQAFHASKGLPPRPDSLSARLSELEADAERTAATRSAQGAYFGSSSASDRDLSHRSRLENLSVTAPFALGAAPQTDASSLFNPAPQYRDKVALGGHSGGQKQAMRGNALRANLDPSRIDAAPTAAASGAAVAPAALSGVPLSFFGVSTDLTRGQSRIQQRWLTNLGVSDVVPRKDGPLSPRKPMGDAAAKRASRPSSAVGAPGAAAGASVEPEPQQPQGPVFIPPLHIPVHPWQPSMQASKPDAMHLHAVLPAQHFEIPLHPQHVPHHLHYSAANQPAPPAPSAVSAYRPSSGRSSRPSSSTSRSQRIQQQVSAAAAASAGAGSSRPASATSLGASKSRPSTANKKALSSRPITDARIDSDVQATFIPGAAEASAFALNIQGSNAGLIEPVASHLVHRPSTVDAQRAGSQQPQQQPSNQYRPSQSGYVADEKDDGDDAIPFEQEYARFLAREQASALAGAQTSRPASSASARPAPATARPASGRGSGTIPRSRPASGSSTARRQQQEPLLSSFYAGNNTSRQAAATAASLSLYSGGPSALVRVSDRGLTNDVHFADRQNGLLLTTRARPPFMTGSRNDGHSAVPLHSAALKPNAGFQTELGVSAQLLGDFIARAEAELPHFYSRHLFWDYRLTEMLRATEPDMVSEVAGNTMAGSGTRSNTTAAAGGAAEASRAKTVDSSSDHVYPSTYRIMAASYILQQVLPMLHTPHPETQTNTKSQEAANAAAQAPSTRALLRTALDVLHRSIYQPAPVVAASTTRSGPSPNELARQMAAFAPHEELTTDQLWTGTQGEAPQMSRRAKQIAAVPSSGYGQASHTDDSAELRDDLRQADRAAQRAFEHAISSEGQSSLLHAQARSLASGVSTPLTSAAPLSSAAAPAAPAYPIPYFLAVRYLYEGTQSFLLGSEKLSAKLARVDGSIDRIFARSARRLVTLAFKAWQGRVRTHRQKMNLAGFLTRKSRTQSAKRSPHLIFAMWKSFAARQALKRRYRKELGSMNAEIKTISSRLSRTHTSDREALLEQMAAIQSSFVALEAGGKFRSTPVDVFSPLMLHLVLERYAEQIEMVDALSASCVDLLPLASDFSKARAVAVEVDMLVDELGSLSSSAQLANLAEIRAHLSAKLGSLGRAEEEQEETMMQSLIYLSAEDFIFRWVNCHLTESRAGRTLEDLAQLISGGAGAGVGGIYLELLKSVAPAVVDAVGKDLRGAATLGLGGSAPPSSSSAASTADFETRTIAHAKWVLGVAAELGCTPVISIEEFLAHPNHAGVIARWKAQQDARALHGGAMVSDGSASGAQSQAAAPFDPSGLSMHSAHPADAGLTPAELGLAVDEQGVPLHARRHMFDELGAELLEQQAEKQKKKQQQAGAGKAPSIQQLLADSKFAAPRSHLDSVTPANPHLHLCLLASLVLQRPSLPPTASAASTSFVYGSKWLESTRARVGQMQAQWEALKQRHGVSLRDMESYLAQLQHVGLEIDVALRRGQRRSRSFAAIKAKMEELLWQLQKRKQTTTSASGSDSSASGATVVDGMVQSDLKRANLRLQALSYNEIPLGKLMDVLQPASASARADQALRDYGEIRHLLGKHYAELANIFRHYASLGFDDGATASGAADAGATSPTAAAAAKKNPAALSAASTAGAALSFAEFVVLCQDCHLLSKKLHKGVLHTLFTRCTLTLKQLAAQSNHTMPHTDADRLEHSPLGGEELLANAAAAAKGSGIANKTALTSSSAGDVASFSAGGSSLHLTLSQPALFESFIRLGILKYSTVTSLSERVRRLIEMDILPHACRLRLDEFRSLLNRDRVRHVFQAHKQELQIVFQHFAKEDAVAPKDGTVQSAAAKAAAIAAAAKGRVINKAGFLRLAQEAKLLSTPGSSSSHNSAHGLPFFESHLSSILSSVLRVPDVLLSAQASAAAGTGSGAGGSGSSVDFDLSFPEFLESLGSIAAFKFPDPYLPLQVKLENFIAHVLLPPLRRCIRRLNQLMSAAVTTTNTSSSAAGSGSSSTVHSPHVLSPASTSIRSRRLA